MRGLRPSGRGPLIFLSVIYENRIRFRCIVEDSINEQAIIIFKKYYVAF